MLKVIIKFFFLFILINLISLSYSLSQGKYIDSISCLGNPKIIYSAYQPEGYFSGKMIYILDPAGRSELALNKFKIVADHLNIMLICSGNSRNGPIERNITVFEEIFKDCKLRFSFDTTNIILSGFSGGSRAAFKLANYYRNIVSGVIGCGAGIPSNMKITRKPEFSYIGITGIRDMNFYEMIDLDNILNKYSTNASIFFFDGGHSWPPGSVLLLSIKWLNYYLNQDESSLKELFQDYQKIISIDYINYETWVQVYQLKNFIEIFDNHLGIHEEKKKLIDIQQDKKYNKSIKLFDQTKSTFQKEYEIMVDEFRKIGNSKFKKDTLKSTVWWTHKIQMINGLTNSKNIEKRNMGFRLKDFLWRNCYEQGSIYFNNMDYAIVIKYDNIWKLIHPESYIPWIRSASCYLKYGDTSAAIKNLKTGITKGFSNREFIIKNFDELSGKRDYQQMLSDLSDKSQ